MNESLSSLGQNVTASSRMLLKVMASFTQATVPWKHDFEFGSCHAFSLNRISLPTDLFLVTCWAGEGFLVLEERSWTLFYCSTMWPVVRSLLSDRDEQVSKCCLRSLIYRSMPITSVHTHYFSEINVSWSLLGLSGKYGRQATIIILSQASPLNMPCLRVQGSQL